MSSFSGIKNTLLAEQVDEEAAPAHDPNLKNSKAPERYAPGPAVIIYGKKSCFSGALRRLLFVHSLCGDYDDALCYLFAVLIDRLVKCSTHVAVVCGIFSSQFICIRRFIHYLSHEIKRLSAGSELIGVSRSTPDKVICICAARIDSKDLFSFLRQGAVL